MEKERAIIQFGSITCVSRESSKTVLILQKRTKKLAYVLDRKIFPGMFFLSLILSFLNLDKLSRCFGFGSQNRSYFIFGKRLGQKKCNKKLSWWCFPVIYLSKPWFIDLLILNTDHHILSNENRKTTKIFYSLNELDNPKM